MAEIIYISRPTYAEWEKDPGKMPLVALLKLCNCFATHRQFIIKSLFEADFENTNPEKYKHILGN